MGCVSVDHFGHKMSIDDVLQVIDPGDEATIVPAFRDEPSEQGGGIVDLAARPDAMFVDGRLCAEVGKAAARQSFIHQISQIYRVSADVSLISLGARCLRIEDAAELYA